MQENHTEEFVRDDGGKDIIFFNPLNLPVEIISYDKDGNITMKTSYVRDELGVNKETIITKSDGPIISRFEYGYNSLGNLESISRFDGDGNLIEETNYDLPGKEYKDEADKILGGLSSEEKSVIAKRFGINEDPSNQQ
jgi:hypothetical protein